MSPTHRRKEQDPQNRFMPAATAEVDVAHTLPLAHCDNYDIRKVGSMGQHNGIHSAGGHEQGLAGDRQSVAGLLR
jgi:hypothetical protein